VPKPRSSKLESATARLKLPIRKKPHTGPKLARGIQLLYRRNKTAGTWVVKHTLGDGRYAEKGFALADDYEASDHRAVLTFYEAQDAARKIARGGAAPDEEVTTVAAAIDRYRLHLEQQHGDPYNASRIRGHLPASILARPIALLSGQELEQWRDGLLAKGLSRASANRTRTCLRAALSLAAKKDRIADRSAWQDLTSLADATTARNVVLDDATIGRVIAAAYRHDYQLGLLVETLAVTGARPGQAVRLEVADLDLADATAPKLRLPRSAKGGSTARVRKRAERVAVPITTALAGKLRQAAAGRPPEAPLLLRVRANGEAWGHRRSDQYRPGIRAVMAAVGLDPDEATAYCLRHSAITRSLLRGVPLSVVADLSDTSEREIRRHYRRFIASHADEVARRGLLDTPVAPTPSENVVALAPRRG
jgi:integrase